MPHRQLELNATGDLIFRSTPGAAYPIFFSLLSFLHATIAITSFWHKRWEGYLSAVFCMVFAVVAVCCRRFRSELVVEKQFRRIRLHHGVGWLNTGRSLPFSAITAVRLTLLRGDDPDNSHIELLCHNHDIRCPSAPASIRQQALLLAMTLDVPLIKVFGDNAAVENERMKALTS